MASTIPFRFKAGGSNAMTPIPDHHHRSTTKASNKPFKTRHASKSALKERSKGKVEQFERGARKTLHQQVMSKIDRRNHARQLRQNKLGERREEGSVFAGKDGAPRVAAVVALCGDVKREEIIGQMNGSVDAEESGQHSVEVPRFKTRMQYLSPDRTDLFAVLDACRVADYVLFVLSAQEEVDELGEQMLRCVESQGISTVLMGAYGLDRVEPAKKRPDVLKSLKSYINHFFAAQEKVHDLSSRQDCSNVMRSLCTTTPKGIRWREDRSWMYVEDVRWEGEQPVVTGTIRGRNLKADRLVEMGEWGTFQTEKITAAPSEGRSSKRVKVDEMAVDAERTENLLEQPSDDQDDLAELAPEEATMDDVMTMPAASFAASERKHVLLDDHQYFDEDEEEELSAPKKVPRGTSKYQTAWYLGDNSDSGSDMEDIDQEPEGDMDMDGLASAGPADGHFDDMTMGEPTEGAPTTYAQSEMFPDAAPEDEAEQIAAYRKQRRDEAEEGGLQRGLEFVGEK
ncbi:hypothetical protein B0A55_13332 [Friedmanniomyces simplex]|uniref:Bms1-type G domain-containing protein n=1 Tax=Friedmanniomyces simplex TaxID=329884 RepID=A0A4U0W294_9PEZI|nr:hypothetical protein B0A55_13332 [Friedmanniomyces simplex]